MNTKVCEKCDKEMRYIPAGTSKKTGKPYSAFWSCDSRNGGCGNTARAEGEEAMSPMDAGGFPGFGGGNSTNDRITALEAKIDQLIDMVRAMQK